MLIQELFGMFKKDETDNWFIKPVDVRRGQAENVIKFFKLEITTADTLTTFEVNVKGKSEDSVGKLVHSAMLEKAAGTLRGKKVEFETTADPKDTKRIEKDMKKAFKKLK